MIVKEHDVIQLKDGREGTVVYVGQDSPGYLMEPTDKEGKIIEVSPDQIEKVIWRA